MKNHKHKNNYRFPENTFHFFRELFLLSPRVGICFFIAVIGGVLLPFLNARLPRLVLEGLEESWALSLFLERLLFLVFLLALTGIVKSGAASYMETTADVMPDIYNLRIVKKRMAADYEVLENRSFHDEAYAAYHSLYRHHSEIGNGYAIWKEFLTAAVSMVLFGGILLTQSVVILILALLPALTAAFLQQKARAYDQKMRLSAESSNRKMEYTSRLSADPRAGKDIRLFHLSGWLLGILKKERKTSEGHVKRWENAYLAANCTDAFLNFLRDGCAYVFLILQIAAGNMAVSDFVWYMAAVANCQQACDQLLAIGERLGKLNVDYSRLRRFLDGWDGTAFAGCFSTGDSPTIKEAEIEFRHVSYTYPESSVPTLTDLNFTIHPGEKIALVGLNGAGKTTLVKLLCGLYHPTEGEILVNGHRIKDYDRETYYQMISAVFQNVKLLPLSIAQNVASAPEGTIDYDRVRKCLKLAGLWEKVDSLPLKEHTSLGRRVDPKAIDLSGGETQKLWMARAFYKEAPLLILDEPTAALDPLAEQEVYEKYKEMAAGRTSLFISHRLSSTCFCDRIFFMEKGKILEEGNHQALLKKGGAYAGLYHIQSQYYTKEEEPLCVSQTANAAESELSLC